MIWVIDASSVVAYLLGQGSGSEREGLLSQAHAPDLLDIEVTQTLRGLTRAAKIDLPTAQLCRGDLRLLSVRRHPGTRLLDRAWELRDVCTTYDALYVALAEALNATLLTRDGRLARSVVRLINVVVTDPVG